VVGTAYIEWVYNFYAGVYDVVFERFFREGRRRAIQAADIKPGERVLEVGVGTGACLPLMPPGCFITGIDLSEGMLDEARKRVQTLGMTNTRLIRMDATKLDFPDDSFDAIVAAFFITTVPDPRAVVEEMKRVCKKGGRMVFVNHFMAPNVFINDCEEFFAPVFWTLGWRSNLKLSAFLKMTGLSPERVELVDRLGLWRTLHCTNHKVAAGPVEEKTSRKLSLGAALKRWGRKLAVRGRILQEGKRRT
jgi:phosphatidylethanolamine/phosphatidyl-N-methylethanolamine N-methyltransferase